MSHICVTNEGNMKCWGSNNFGQLGLGDVGDRGDSLDEMGLNLPLVKVGKGIKVNHVSTGYLHTCAHLSSNQVKCWGLNDRGQLGLGVASSPIGDKSSETPDKLTAVNVGTVSTPVKVICGYWHTCILFANKQVKCFGFNASGQIGFEGIDPSLGRDSSEMGNNLPFVKLGTGVEVESLYTATAAFHNCVIIATSQLMKCWGYNRHGQLGTVDVGDADQNPYNDRNYVGKSSGTMGDNLQTVDLGTEDRVKQIGIGDYFTCAVRIDDELLCWGNNKYGQLGIGSPNKRVFVMGAALTSTPYDSGKKIKQISAGWFHSCILYDDEITVKCIGHNFAGQLGQGDAANRGGSPTTLIPNIPAIDLDSGSLNISYVAVIKYATCVIFTDYTVKCFGSGQNGALGNGDSTFFIGDGPGEMGSKLPFVNLFPPTTSPTNEPTSAPTAPTSSPTKAPTAFCLHTDKKECKKDKLCAWKKSKCLLFKCSKFATETDCIATTRCIWKKNKCLFVNCTSFKSKNSCTANLQCVWNKNSCSFA